MTEKRFDIAIIGGGIVGLSLALAAARRGKSVAIFERHPRAVGASVRNFGMIWPIGQPTGVLLDRALLSRSIWLDLAQKAQFYYRKSGSMHVAYAADEVAVLEEFYETTRGEGYDCTLIGATAAAGYSPILKTKGLRTALLSHTEVNVDPYEAIAKISHYLSAALGVTFFYNTAVTAIDFPHLVAGGQTVTVNEHTYICSGADFETLFPEDYAHSKLTKCKLQMLSATGLPSQADMGAMLCAGLTLRHYGAFAHCQSLAALDARFDSEDPRFKTYGIHVLVSQNSQQELILGDSHEYGLDISPFEREDINQLILDYLSTFVQMPNMKISRRWQGVYAKHTEGTEWIRHLGPHTTLVNGLGGAGMTLSFGLAEQLFQA